MNEIGGQDGSFSIPRRCVVAESVITELRLTFASATVQRVEGIAYFLGQTNGITSCILAVVPVRAHATFGSFAVESSETARIVELADSRGLQIVGQIHSHPRQAFHSEGDDSGAQIRYDGYVSIVVPDYGRHLPSLEGSATYMYAHALGQFVALASAHVHVIGAALRR